MEDMQSLMKKAMKNAPTTLADSSSNEGPDDEKDLVKQWEQKKCDFYNESEGTLNDRDGYDCPLCKNKGYTAELRKSEEFGYWSETLIPCKCLRVRKIIRRLEKSGLKNIIKDYTFQKYEAKEPWQKSLKDASIRFCTDEKNDWFYLGGMSGSGKTHLCTAIAGYYLKHDKNVKYMLWRDDVVKLKASVNDSTVYASAIDELKTCDVLYVDDLFKTGKGPDGKPAMPTAADVNIAFEIINYRYNNPGLITIISSERSIQDLIQIDEAIAGRIAERSMSAGYGYYIKYDPGKNYRTKGIVEL